MLRGKKVMHLFDDPAFDYLPGESVIIPANVEMKIDFPEAEMNNPTQCLALAIDNKKIVNTLDFLNERYPKEGLANFWQLDDRNYFFYNNQDLAHTINKLIQVCQSTSITKDVLADLAIQELLIHIIQTQSVTSIERGIEATPNPILNNILLLIRANLTQKINLKDIAKQSGMSPASMYRMIKRELGISPVELIIMERIKLAKALLKDQNIFIKNVCYEAGFEDANYFIRAFKLHEGVTPKQYQQMNQLR
jgi:AraC-like DNA-binding protein